METLKLIDKYKATNVSVPNNMIASIISDHAGETGAVWIYLGAKCVFWNKKIKKMSVEHYETEKNHLLVMKHILPKANRSKLLILWRILGFSLGFLSALGGYRTFCITIQSVETFVEKHYQEQIKFLYKNSISFDLLKDLEICCEEEVEHKIDAKRDKGNSKNTFFENFWSSIISSGSSVAVKASKLI